MAQRLDPLTSLRFIAALGVFVFHWRALGVAVPQFGAMGVSFFFVLSGFILTYAHPDVPSAPEFYRRRFARIWPVHFLTFLLCAISTVGAFPFLLALVNLSLLHAWIPSPKSVFSFNSVSWSISVELFFYLLFPWIARSRRIAPWLIGSALATSAIVLSADRHWSEPLLTSAFSWPSLHQNPLTRLLEFVVGVALGRYFIRSSGRPPRLLALYPTLTELVAIGLVVLCLAATSYEWTGHPGITAWYTQAGALPGFALAILVFAYGRGQLSRLLSLPVFVLLGEISFSTYMLHQIVIKQAARQAVPEKLGLPLTLVLVTAITYASSYLVWRWLEKPARQALVARSFLATRQQEA